MLLPIGFQPDGISAHFKFAIFACYAMIARRQIMRFLFEFTWSFTSDLYFASISSWIPVSFFVQMLSIGYIDKFLFDHFFLIF